MIHVAEGLEEFRSCTWRESFVLPMGSQWGHRKPLTFLASIGLTILKVKVESEKVGLKLNIQETKIMASGHITSWQTDAETVADFIFLGSKITADGDCSHEIKRRLLLGRKVMTNLDSIL